MMTHFKSFLVLSIGIALLVAVAWTLFSTNKIQPIQRIDLPSLGTTSTEPNQKLTSPAAESIPELNPIEKTNPFQGSYKNPFPKK